MLNWIHLIIYDDADMPPTLILFVGVCAQTRVQPTDDIVLMAQALEKIFLQKVAQMPQEEVALLPPAPKGKNKSKQPAAGTTGATHTPLNHHCLVLSVSSTYMCRLSSNIQL